MKKILILMATGALLASAAWADDKLEFTVQSPKWGKVEFSFDGLKACAENKGERMCGTADKVPQPGEEFTMSWAWPQKKWKRPK